MQFNPLPNDKILHKSKLKAVADNKINVAEKLKTVLEGWKTLWVKKKMLVTRLLKTISPLLILFSKAYIKTQDW